MTRKTGEERMAALEARKKQIEAQLASLAAREKQAAHKRDTRRKVIVGAAVLAHAEIDPRFAVLLRDILQRAVQRPADQANIVDLLEPVAPSA
jgi:hypothetical protein